jgi:hypothetical protein
VALAAIKGDRTNEAQVDLLYRQIGQLKGWFPLPKHHPSKTLAAPSSSFFFQL